MNCRIISRALVGLVVCATALIGVGASSASAGEITGGGRSLATVPTGNPERPFVIHGKSICAYSGLNDEYVLADEDDKDDFAPSRTLPKRLLALLASPATRRARAAECPAPEQSSAPAPWSRGRCCSVGTRNSALQACQQRGRAER